MFQQSKWLEPYIRLNTEKRKQAKNSFEKDFYKLMNNSVFGKTMENVRNRKNIELVKDAKRFKKLVAKPTFHRFKIFDEKLTAVHCLKSKLMLDKPRQVGLAILDLSKVLMFDFHYNYMLVKYPNAKLLFSDTDSLCYHIETEDIYKDMQQDAIHFDTSDYPSDHFLHSNVNKKVLGKMKDETAGIPIDEFVGLRPKMYSMTYGEKEKKTAKGITRACQKKIRHEAYKRCLFDEENTVAVGNRICSHGHKICSEAFTKVALSSFDDKRYVLEDKCTTLAHGYYKTRIEPEMDISE